MKTTIDELIANDGGEIKTGPFGTTLKASEYTQTGVPLISVGEVGKGRLRIHAKTPRISPETIQRLPEYVLKSGDIVFGRKGAVERSALIQPEQDGWFLGSDGIRLRLPKSCDPRFVSYWLQTYGHKQWIVSNATGSTMASLNQKIVGRIPLPLPPLPEQRAIAAVLSALDDKIELNRRMNETLERQARALFRDWFVDFGPTRAKMAQSATESVTESATESGIGAKPQTALPAPYLSPALWSLFPDRLDDAGKPEGWEFGKMEDLFVLQRGFDLPARDRRAGSYPIMAASGHNGSHDAFMVKGPGVTTGRSGVLGKVFYVDEDFWPLNTSLWIKAFKRASPLFAYFFLELIDLAGFNGGSAVPTLNRNHIHGLPTVLPPRELVEALDKTAIPLMKRRKLNDEHSRTLAQTRDLLLPRLMSGELRVAEAARAVEEVL